MVSSYGGHTAPLLLHFGAQSKLQGQPKRGEGTVSLDVRNGNTGMGGIAVATTYRSVHLALSLENRVLEQELSLAIICFTAP